MSANFCTYIHTYIHTDISPILIFLSSWGPKTSKTIKNSRADFYAKTLIVIFDKFGNSQILVDLGAEISGYELGIGRIKAIFTWYKKLDLTIAIGLKIKIISLRRKLNIFCCKFEITAWTSRRNCVGYFQKSLKPFPCYVKTRYLWSTFFVA